MVLISSSRITNKNKENAHISFENATGTKGSVVPRKRTHVIHPKTCLVPAARPESLCSLLREHCSLTKNLSKGVDLRGKLRLPKTLRRPVFRPIAPQCLTAVDPGLAGVPLEYIQQGLREKSERLYNATLKIAPKQTQIDGTLPKTMEVTVLDDSIEVPTHILAVYATPDGALKGQISLHPAHSIVLVSQCAHIPPMTSSALPSSSVDSKTLVLPILPMCLPNPRTFPLLLRYLYAHRRPEILSALLRLPLPTQNLSVDEASLKLVSACNAPTLLSLISSVHGLWSNVAALGIAESSLWEVLDFSWEALLAALESKSKPKEVL